jgi:hypothetical protein
LKSDNPLLVFGLLHGLLAKDRDKMLSHGVLDCFRGLLSEFFLRVVRALDQPHRGFAATDHEAIFRVYPLRTDDVGRPFASRTRRNTNACGNGESIKVQPLDNQFLQPVRRKRHLSSPSAALPAHPDCRSRGLGKRPNQ